MTPDRWKRICEILDEALETDPPLRAGLIRRACQDEPGLEGDVLRLLEAHEASGPLDAIPEVSRRLPEVLTDPSWVFEPGLVLAGRFELGQPLGRGGMGEVWAAYDRQLQDAVAVKTVRATALVEPEAVARFKREVQLARQVAHPNVCRVHDLFFHEGLPFLTMELLGGRTLAARLAEGPMAETEASEILRQCAAGLEAAHAQGLVHRDFKPGNVMLCAGPRAVVMDFGLARPVPTAGAATASAAGTPAFMAPEQGAGLAVTPAADVYAFAVVACQMLTGQRPAEGGLALLPARWRRALEPALSADPDGRPRSPGAVLDAARGSWVSGRRGVMAAAGLAAVAWVGQWSRSAREEPTPEPGLAVLPFESPGDAAAGEMAAADLADALSRVPGLRVVARSSSVQFAALALPAREAPGRLAVRHLVTGRVEAGYRWTVRLVDAEKDQQVWAERFSRDAGAAAARAIAARLGRTAPVAGPARPGPATQAYLNGRYHLNRRIPAGIEQAASYFEEALRREPGFAAGHAALAQTRVVQAEMGLAPNRRAAEQAEASAQRALELDARSAEALTVLALLEATAHHRFAAAERKFLQAIDLEPNLLVARQWFSSMLVRRRRFEEARQQAVAGLELDPLALPARQGVALVHFFARQWPELRGQCAKLLELEPRHPAARLLLAQAAALSGDRAELEQQLALAGEGATDSVLFLRMASEAWSMAGVPERATPLLDRLLAARPAISHTYAAAALAAAGRRDEAFVRLEQAWEAGELFLSIVGVYPAFDGLRSDARYRSLAGRLGLTN